MRRRLLSLLLVAVIILSCFAFSISAYGSTQQLILNTKMSNTIDGSEDMGWYTYTPDASGTYSFLSYNVPASEAYLFIKETNEETGAKVYTQLAYSKNDPNYEENDHNIQQFCLTYHLMRGVTYYFAAGWLLPDRTSGTMTVMLRCDEYDEKIIESISLTCPAMLNVYADGNWMTDSDGERYYFYNISKIISNMTVTVYYSTGEVSSVIGQNEIDGYNISYLHNQSTVHWYPKEHDSYTANTLTVKILDVTADYEVQILSSARYIVQGTISSKNKTFVKDAEIYYKNELLATTNSSGYFTFSYPAGQYVLTVKAPNSLSREITVVVSTSNTDNNYTQTPVVLYTCDYVNDGIINAKDYACITKLEDEAQFIKDDAQYKSAINYTSDNYEPFTLGSFY
ncbi:MAG: carboxypeptidase-like regulatory domain-containing protein [Eubacterium sp.]